MDGYAAYKYYLAIKLHFTSNSYDVFEKRGAVKYSMDMYEKRNDRLIFENIARKFKTDHDLIQFFASNFAYGNKAPAYEMEESERYYTNWIKRKESMTEMFRNDLEVIINDAHKHDLKKECVLGFTFNQPPSILTLYLGNRISIETLSILNDCMSLCENWTMTGFVMTFWEIELRKINKVRRFVKYDKQKIFPLVQEFEHELMEL